MKQFRYPGAQPFTTAQKDLFFGRDEDITKLHRLVKTESLVVLHAKSGMGKSSLLNAGIIPAVIQETEYTPLHIRFNAWTEGKLDLPADITRKTISPEGSKRTFIDSLINNEQSLWHELKETQLLSEGQRKYLLIFDQFEELFTYPVDAISAFRDQLAEALYTRIPQRYRKVLEAQIEQGVCTLKDQDFDRLQEPITVKILLSVRSDRLHLMDRLSVSLPDILGNCYELETISPAQAITAIVEPARRSGDFTAPVFTFSAAAVDHVVDFLDDAERRIETIQLQILCRTFEERVIQEKITHFEKETLGELEDIISSFYSRQIDLLGSEMDQYRARLLIEEGLIVPEDRQRLTLHEAQILSLFQVPRAHLAILVDGGLLRAEPALRGGYAFELSHDTLVGPALEARSKRREQEANAAKLVQEQAVAKALAEERQKRQRSRFLAITFAILSAISLVAAVWAWQQTRIAKAAEQNANAQKLEAERQRQEALNQGKIAKESSQVALLNEQKALDEKEQADLQRSLAVEAKRVAQLLATKGNRLESTISREDTYAYLMLEGRSYLKEGNYRTALTNFATARFVQESQEANLGINAAKTGLEAEMHIIAGDLDAARNAYLRLQNAMPDTSLYLAQRLEAIQQTQAVFQVLQKGQKWKELKTLQLDSKGLSVLPASIGDFSNLRVLDLSQNSGLSYLPVSITRLSQLQKLVINDAGLLSLPDAIGQLKSLEELILVNNQALELLPKSIGQLKQLRVLSLESCSFQQLTQEIGQLERLNQLDLSENPLVALPLELAQLKQLSTLKLSLLKTGLRFDWAGTFEILEQMPNLNTVDLSKNMLHKLQPEVLVGLAKLQNLKKLNLRNNSFDEASRQQIRIWLPNCKIEF